MRRTWGFLVASALVVSASSAMAESPLVFLMKWGVAGAGTGQFMFPRGIAVDGVGDVYVADQGNNRIQKFTSSGVFVTQWGTLGTGNSQFNGPYNIAIDAAGNVYVVDGGNNRIQKFTSAGVYVTQWGVAGSGDGQFNTPTGVAVGPAGNIYVTDTNNNRVQKFTNTGAYLTQWGGSGAGNGQFNKPYGVVVDASANVYVSDFFNNRVQKFSTNGGYISQWGSFGTGNGQFNGPLGLALDAAGHVYVTDYQGDRIEKFTNTGAYLTQWGSMGSGNSQFVNPASLFEAGGDVVVADFNNNRVQEFAASEEITAVTDVGDDDGRQVRIRVAASGLDVPGSPTPITGYALYRRIDPLPALAPTATSRSAAGRFRVPTTPADILLDGWDYIVTAGAQGDAAYDVVVPTLADSNSTGIAWSVFLVRALTATPTTYFESAADSGYSVDNFPLAPPAPFTAAYISGATDLHWGSNTEPDFGFYNLYRGNSAGFTPRAGNLIASQRDTGYVDVGPAGSYYKLSAVDDIGNESGFSLVTPAATLGVADDPLALALGHLADPAIGGRLTVTFTLPIGAPATLEVLDVSGRRATVREVGSLGAGRHAIDLAADHRFSPGVYFVRLTQGARRVSARVTVLE